MGCAVCVLGRRRIRDHNSGCDHVVAKVAEDVLSSLEFDLTAETDFGQPKLAVFAQTCQVRRLEPPKWGTEGWGAPKFALFLPFPATITFFRV